MEKNNFKIPVAKLRRFCDPKNLNFKSTADLAELKGVIGQDKALNALSFGIDIKSHGYHVYALGPIGTGKSTTIAKFLARDAKSKPVPNDWLYVNNFEDRDSPHVLHLPAGKGREFRDDMDQMVAELKTEVPKAFEGKEYEKEKERIEQEFQRRSKELFQDLEKKADKSGFRLVQTAQGMAAFPVIEGKVLMPDENPELDEKEWQKIEAKEEELQAKMLDTLRKIEDLQKEGKKRIKELDRRVVGFAVEHLINELKAKYKEFKEVIDYLVEAHEFLMKNVQAFKQLKYGESETAQSRLLAFGGQEPSFDECRVNLIVDNSKSQGAPVIFEKNPTGSNLMGRIEHQGYFGTLVTNFSMLRAGSLHKANGGYLIIEVFDLLTRPFSWYILKRALRNREIVIENVGEMFAPLLTRTLEPEPIPLSVKVILIGDPFLYHLLYAWDQEFRELFRVKAEFGGKMDWSNGAVKQYAQFIGTVCSEENLKHFDPSGVAKIVEYGSRIVSQQNKLATRFGDIVNLVREASFWASQNGNHLVKAADVEKALAEKVYRSNRIEEEIREMIDDGTIFIDTEGKVTGQINGIAVVSLGDYMFGKPDRITARTFAGTKGVVHIDREVKLGGPIYSKGSMILAGFLGGRYATDIPLSFSASITFEQSYSEVEGDSASSTELYALLSSLSGFPLRQDIAVTGSVNQHGEIQPIGGVNEKIEGFYQVCKMKKLTGTQGVMIPKTNVKHLMLQEEVVDAVKAGKFHIYAVATIDEGIELLTSKKAGQKNAKGKYPKNTVNGAVQQRLLHLAEQARDFMGSQKK